MNEYSLLYQVPIHHSLLTQPEKYYRNLNSNRQSIRWVQMKSTSVYGFTGSDVERHRADRARKEIAKWINQPVLAPEPLREFFAEINAINPNEKVKANFFEWAGEFIPFFKDLINQHNNLFPIGIEIYSFLDVSAIRLRRKNIKGVGYGLLTLLEDIETDLCPSHILQTIACDQLSFDIKAHSDEPTLQSLSIFPSLSYYYSLAFKDLEQATEFKIYYGDQLHIHS